MVNLTYGIRRVCVSHQLHIYKIQLESDFTANSVVSMGIWTSNQRKISWWNNEVRKLSTRRLFLGLIFKFVWWGTLHIAKKC